MAETVPTRGAALVLLLLACPDSAHADEFHYQSLLVGQRAVGLGGAFTGLADDPSAAFYNPGGLATLVDDGLSLSLSVNAFDRRVVKDGLVSSLSTEDMIHDGKPVVPVSATVMLKLGKKDPDGLRPHAVAFSTITRDRQDFTFTASTAGQLDPARRRGAEAEVRTERTELWYGPSYAYRINPRVSLGLTAFFSVLRKRYDLSGTRLDGDAAGPVGEQAVGFGNPYLLQIRRSLETDTKRLCLRLGVRYQPLAHLSLGLMVQTPTLHLRSKGTLEEREIEIEGETQVGNYFEAERDVTSTSPDPWEVRVGLAYRLTPWLLFSLDGSVYGPTGSAKHPQQTLQVETSDDPDDREPRLGNYFMQQWYRRPTGNVSIGAETALGAYVDLYTGFFTDMSSAPRIQADAKEYTEPDVNHLGVSLSLGINKNRYKMSAGATALWGAGKGYAIDVSTLPESAPLTSTTVKDRTFYVFLSGHTRTVTRATEQAYDKLSERRKRRRREEEEDAASESARPSKNGD